MKPKTNFIIITAFSIFLSVFFSNSKKEESQTETVEFNNSTIKLKGTFYKPFSAAPYPVIVLAHGSGKGNRGSFYYTPYGEYFSKNGIAVLIFDKRGTGDSDGVYDDNPDFTLLAADLQEAFNYVINRPDVDKSKVGIIGISQAAWVLPIALQKLNNVAFTICTSCPMVPPYQSDLFQKGRQLKEEGFSDSDINHILEYNRTVTEYVATFENRQNVIDLKQKYKSKKWFQDFEYSAELSPEDTLKTDRYDHYRKSVFNPIPLWQKVTSPLLLVYGGKDSHIPVEGSIKMVTDSLSDKSNIQFKTFNNEGHLMQPVKEPVEALTYGIKHIFQGKPKPTIEYLDYLKKYIHGK
ncbi:MAG: alpha/beta fold hydrolase [Saprospiraceae bacterium]|nr:alpha/beta fold hydrolase [Saprospiraceae bacterium]